MPPPPPAHGIASRVFLGPALRTQSDRRLVTLVRQGYETAFEEIVRRYARALGRYAAAIVPRHRAEDVTQDAFAKALLALRGSDTEIELRPWLFRIVRNTALNDLRDQPAPAQALQDDALAGGSAFDEAARRAELTDLIDRLRALPEPQRAAIVMRELEGLSHEEIAAALGLTGGAARQVIYRARMRLRDGLGVLIPLPLLKGLLAGGAAPATASAAAGMGGGAAAGGGAGVGVGIKAAAATLLVAGTVGTGVALDERGRSDDGGQAAAAERRVDRSANGGPAVGSGGGGGGTQLAAAGGSDDDSSGEGRDDDGDNRDHGPGSDDSGPSASSGPGSGGERESAEDEDHSGPGPSGSGHSGSSGSGSGHGGGDDRSDSSGPGPAPTGSSSSGPGSGSTDVDDGSGSGSSGPGSGFDSDSSSGSGSGSSGPGGGDDWLPELDD